jgi:hypothetical protein
MKNYNYFRDYSMMKYKIKGVLLCVIAGFGQDTQAMGGARNFAGKVFRSKTAAVAGVLAGVNGAAFYGLFQDEMQNIENAGTTLSQESQEEVKAFFKTHGYFPVIKDCEGISPRVAKKGDTSFLLLDKRSRDVLDENTLDEVLEKKHILNGIAGHEVDHLKHPDVVERKIEESITAPAAIMAGKMVRVAGGSKKLMIATGIFSLYSILFLQKKRAQQQEERCDRNAADTLERAENLAFYFNELGLPLEKDLHAKISKNVQELDVSEQSKERVVTFLTDVIWLLQDHPRPSKRIAYLEEIAAQKKKQEQK